ncbi:MAG: PD40 domain-containing protein [Anaerolineales bacterium]|nr:PD40 domain-containing protein [Anaerolineales bacterium]
MRSYLFIGTVTFMFLLAACGPQATKEFPPTETLPPSATSTPAAQAPTETALPRNPLQIIQPGNVARLQLMKTLPAEMPLQRSAVAISPDGKTMAIGASTGNKISFFDLPAWGLSRTVSIDILNVGAYFHIDELEYLPDGTLMANSSGPYRIYHIDATGGILSAWDGIYFALSADKKIMAHNAGPGIALVDIADNTQLLSLEDPDALTFSFSPDGSRLAAEDVGVDFLRTVIWDIPSQTILATLNDMGNPRFSPNGKFLVTTDMTGDGTVLNIFDVDGKTQLATLDGNTPLPSTDGQMIIAQTPQGGPVAWETTNWQPLEIPIIEGRLDSFSPDGRILITRGDDGAILLWGVLP